MQFIRSEGTEELVEALVSALSTSLATNEAVLWIVTGGSNIDSVVKVLDRLEAADLHNLTLILSDERFGPTGHTDSNFFQLHKNGLNERGATFVDLLNGASFEETVTAGSLAMEHLFLNSQTIIALLGMGPDGHIAGILPHSLAAVNDEMWMVGYDGGQFQRFTLTPFALSHVQTAFVGAFGIEKLGALLNLRDKMLPITEQPAQILRHIDDVYIYNNQIGDIK